MANARQFFPDVARLRDEFGTDEQHRRPAVVDDEGDLGRGEPPVHRRHHDACLYCTQQQFEIDVAVLAEIGDPLARLDAERYKRIGDAIGLDVEFGERGLAALEFKRDRLAAALGAVTHYLCKVCRLLWGGHVSPVVFLVIYLRDDMGSEPAAQSSAVASEATHFCAC
jgi:hypothetical protein